MYFLTLKGLLFFKFEEQIEFGKGCVWNTCLAWLSLREKNTTTEKMCHLFASGGRGKDGKGVKKGGGEGGSGSV